jgi:uncharacterized protein (DUF427 family)
LDAIRWQYLHGVADQDLVSPETWYHDFALVSRPGNDQVQLRLFAEYARTSRADAVRRAAAPQDARPVRRRLDRRQRECRAAARTGPIPGGLLLDRRRHGRRARAHRPHHPARDLGTTAWYTVKAGSKDRAAYQHVELPDHADMLRDRVALAWRAMDAFYEEDERIVGHSADPYHRIDIRQTSRHLTVRHGDRLIADTKGPLALYESGFAPRWYVPRDDVDESALTPLKLQTFCPYKGVCGYFDIGDAAEAAWYYPDAWTEVKSIAGLMSFEADKVDVALDGVPQRPEPGQTMVPHGIDRDLTLDEIALTKP